MELYVIHWLAQELGGNYISSMIEYATADKSKAEDFFVQHAVNEQIMNIDGHMCQIHRRIVPVALDQQYKP